MSLLRFRECIKSELEVLLSAVDVSLRIGDEDLFFYGISKIEELQIDYFLDILKNEKILGKLIELRVEEINDCLSVTYRFSHTFFLTNEFVDSLEKYEEIIRPYSGFIKLSQKSNEIKVIYHEKVNFSLIS